MQTIGIIAEYNPFHNGHLFQIEQIRQKTGAQNVIIVMSGDYVQRGTPAWTDKYLRTQMALSAGADMVFELPVCFSTASAESFALAGVSLLSSLGFADGICFGCECAELSILPEIADFLSNPPEMFEQTIAALAAQGYSYPAAREKAIYKFLPEEYTKNKTLLNSPNNILAIEYLKALRTTGSSLRPVAIQRNDTGYHSHNLTGTFSSAAAIRKEYSRNRKDFLSAIADSVPDCVHKLLQQHPNRYPVTADDFSQLLYYRLCQLSESDRNISDMTGDIFSRIQKHMDVYTGFTDFAAKIKTKQYTYSRISRVLLHCLLNIYTPDHTCRTTAAHVPYARLLGFSREKSSLLRRESSIPVITKPADGISQLNSFYQASPSVAQTAIQMYQKDLFASDLYRRVQTSLHHCCRHSEYHHHPILA